MIKTLFISILVLGLAASTFAQSNTKKNIKPGSTVPVAGEGDSQRGSEKKNGRVEHVPPAATSAAFQPAFIYQLVRPGFTYSKVVIRHDDKGAGDITFEKDGSGESITDPIQLSPETLTKLKQVFADLNFVDSAEDYQYERDYSHLGNIEITAISKGKSRTAKFNWTSNKLAKELADEYRRISNEYTWIFEMHIALENQPLQSPGLMDLLTDYVQRHEISDPPHMLPLLRKLASDERMPLMGRNRASKLIEKLSKTSK